MNKQSGLNFFCGEINRKLVVCEWCLLLCPASLFSVNQLLRSLTLDLLDPLDFSLPPRPPTRPLGKKNVNPGHRVWFECGDADWTV